METTDFKRPSGFQITLTIMALALACFLEGASDWFASLNPPRLTSGAIMFAAVGHLIIMLMIGIPITLLIWNRLVAPIFGVPKIRYLHGLVLATAIYWVKGL